MDGDARRTTTLKQKIENLTHEGENLKAIIRMICEAPDREGAVTIVKQLQQGDFNNTREILRQLRANTTGYGTDGMDRSSQRLDEDYDDDEGLAFTPDSSNWMPELQSPVFSRPEVVWPYKSNTGEVRTLSGPGLLLVARGDDVALDTLKCSRSDCGPGALQRFRTVER
jgi:hypothetical protein